MRVLTVTEKAESILFKQLSRFKELNGNFLFTRNDKKRQVAIELLSGINLMNDKFYDRLLNENLDHCINAPKISYN